MTEPETPMAAPAVKTQEEESLQVVGFQVGNESFAFDILEVVGVERLENVLRFPRMPDFVQGVMTIREEIVAIIKLRTRFGFPEMEQDADARVIVIEIGNETLGFIVDSVAAVRRVQKDQVEPAPPLAITAASRFVRGVCRIDDEMVILLDSHNILFEEELARLRSAVTEVDGASR